MTNANDLMGAMRSALSDVRERKIEARRTGDYGQETMLDMQINHLSAVVTDWGLVQLIAKKSLEKGE